MESPIPIPVDFVVKNASNSRSMSFGSIPVPESSMVTRMLDESSISDLIRNRRARSVTELIASIAFVIKFRKFCDRSARDRRKGVTAVLRERPGPAGRAGID